MITFSTDDLAPEDRFEHWREVRGKALYGVTIELERAHRSAFRGRFSAAVIGGAVVSEMRASSYRVSRTTADIARRPADGLAIGWQVRGPGWMDVGRGPAQAVGEGDLTIGHADLPFAATPRRQDGFRFHAIKIPLTDDRLLGASAEDLFSAVVADHGIRTPLVATVRAFARHDLGNIDPAAETVHLVRLALLARGRIKPGAPETRAALRAGLLHAARDILRRDLRRPDLSPATVARELGVSPHQVHVLFEPTGSSLSRTLAALRAAEARRMLTGHPALSVTAIAYACGFDSLATFYRAFHQAYGMAPGEARRAAPDAACD